MEELSVGNICDIVLAIFFLILVIRGYCAGLVLQVAHLVVLFASIVVSKVFAEVIGIPLLSGLFFLIALVVFWQLIKLIKIVDLIPVVGTLDKLCGAVAGFCIAFLICYFLLGFLDDVIPQKLWNEWGLTKKAVKETYILQAFLR